MKGTDAKKHFNDIVKRIRNESLNKIYSDIVTANWDDPWDRGSVNGKSYRDDSIYSAKVKRRHEFSPILLSFATVYDCKHCGAKKEEAKTDYCDEQDDTDYDTGGW